MTSELFSDWTQDSFFLHRIDSLLDCLQHMTSAETAKDIRELLSTGEPRLFIVDVENNQIKINIDFGG